MDILRRALTVDQAALEQYRPLSDQQLYELFAAEKAQHDSFAPAYPTFRRSNRNVVDSRDQTTYLAQHEKLMALQAAILERPSAASHPDFQSLVAMQRRGCVGAMVYGCVSMAILT